MSEALPGFLAFASGHGLLCERDFGFPTRVQLQRDAPFALGADATHYCFAHEGTHCLLAAGREHALGEGMYASVAGAAQLTGRGRALVVSRVGYRGWLQLGGPLEAQGRLRYIDGCTDSLLLAPPVLGDPCLNHLHIPARTLQSEHTHPTLRVGIVARGRGECVTPHGRHPLAAGLVFVLEPHGRHAFHTADSALDVVVYHPDSDFGPTHEDHPMKNRTILERTP